MPENDLPTFDSSGEPETGPDYLQREGPGTQTIDLSSLFDADVSISGTFDLSGVGSTSFGRLLDALPMPAILIDQSNRVVFSNQGCAKLTSGYHKMLGVPFLDLVPRPADWVKAQVLADKTLALLDRVFRTRKPLTAEAILEIHRKRVWARLNLRAVRIASERYVLVLIEDVTNEKRQLEINRRRDKESEELRRDLEALVDAANTELADANVRLRREAADHLKTQQLLKTEEQKCEMLAQQAELATAVVTPTGAFHSMDSRFRELCKYELPDVPNLTELMTGGSQDRNCRQETAQGWPARFDRAADEGTTAVACVVNCRDGEKCHVRVRAVKLDDGNYFIACEKQEDHPQHQPIH
jgi:PAS domain-containing protein